MRVIPCPICGRPPKIIECVPLKNGVRRRLCGCSNYDSVIPTPSLINTSHFICQGDGDDNAIYKLWNLAIERYNKNKTKDWFEKDFSHWSDNLHIKW